MAVNAPTSEDPRTWLKGVEDEPRRADAFTLLEMMERVTGEPPVMWGPSMVGFGSYHYRYDSGREGDWFLTGFAPRKANLSVYIVTGFEPYEDELSRLGKHKTSKSCLTIKRLADIDMAVLKEIVTSSVRRMRATYGV